MTNGFTIAQKFNPLQARLKEIILKSDFFNEAVSLAEEIHAITHDSAVSSSSKPTFFDEVISDADEKRFRQTVKGGWSFALNIWHITRIEDICANLLIDGGEQVINGDNYIARLNCTVTDTGNSMTEAEVAEFGEKINPEELLSYRRAVGRRTRAVLKTLKPCDMKRKMSPHNLERITAEKAVAQNSLWLIDFWGRKNVAGLILMPLTRHQIVHLNDCLKIKKKIKND